MECTSGLLLLSRFVWRYQQFYPTLLLYKVQMLSQWQRQEGLSITMTSFWSLGHFENILGETLWSTGRVLRMHDPKKHSVAKAGLFLMNEGGKGVQGQEENGWMPLQKKVWLEESRFDLEESSSIWGHETLVDILWVTQIRVSWARKVFHCISLVLGTVEILSGSSFFCILNSFS